MHVWSGEEESPSTQLPTPVTQGLGDSRVPGTLVTVIFTNPTATLLDRSSRIAFAPNISL